VLNSSGLYVQTITGQNLIIGVFHPPMHLESFGGSIAVTISIVNTLAENGYKVVLYTRKKPDQEKLSKIMGEPLSKGIMVIVKPSILRSRNLVNLYENAFKLLTLKLKCDLTIDTYSCYIFPWTNIAYIHFPYVNNLSFKKRFPYIIKRRGILSDSINIPYIFFERNFEKYNQKLLIANSYFTATAIKEALGVNAEVIYPSISTTFLQGLSIYGKEHRENLVVTVGRITADKKLWMIPQIAHMMRRKDVKFTIVGFLHDHRVYEKINTKIKEFNLQDRFQVLTNISKRELVEILGRAKVYVHPPTVEHFGISIAEAMAMGCIPVIYEVGGAKEFVPQKYVYTDIREASEKVENAIDLWSTKKAKEMNSIVQKFSEQNFRKRFSEIFSKYLKQIDIS